jgi:hypothetical protein
VSPDTPDPQSSPAPVAEEAADVLELTANDIAAEGEADLAVAENFAAVSVANIEVDQDNEEGSIDISSFSVKAEGENGDASKPEASETNKKGAGDVGEEAQSLDKEQQGEASQEGQPEPDTVLDPDKSDEEVEAELDALLAGAQEGEEEQAESTPGEEKPQDAAENNSEDAAEEAPPEKSAEALAAEMLGETSAPAPEEAPSAAVDAAEKSPEESGEQETQKTETDAEAMAAEMLGETPAEAVEAPEPAAVEEKPEVESVEAAEPAGEEKEKPAEGKAEEPVSVEESAPVAEASEEQPATDSPSKKVHLSAVPSPNGLQVAFPAEVLAEALRPLVHDWVNEHLPELVESLVREELAKLADE